MYQLKPDPPLANFCISNSTAGPWNGHLSIWHIWKLPAIAIRMFQKYLDQLWDKESRFVLESILDLFHESSNRAPWLHLSIKIPSSGITAEHPMMCFWAVWNIQCVPLGSSTNTTYFNFQDKQVDTIGCRCWHQFVGDVVSVETILSSGFYFAERWRELTSFVNIKLPPQPPLIKWALEDMTMMMVLVVKTMSLGSYQLFPLRSCSVKFCFWSS